MSVGHSLFNTMTLVQANSLLYMSWETVVIIALLVIMLVHCILTGMYINRLRQLEADIEEMESVHSDNIYLEEAIIERVMMSAQAKVDRDSNLHAIIVNLVCFIGLLILDLLPQTMQIEEVGSMFLLLLPIPVVLLIYHLRSKFAWSIVKG